MFTNLIYWIMLGMIHIWRAWKFPRPPTTPLPTHRNPPCLSRSEIFPSTWPWTSNFKRISPSPQVITNQLKENIIQRWLFMLSSPLFRSTFVYIINILILSVFLLTSFHLAEDSLSAYLWLYTLVCAVVQKYHNYSHF